jgi:hypothetical protein
VQYIDYLGKLVQGDLGISLLARGTPVADIIKTVLPWTLFSVGTGLMISFTLIGLGFLTKGPVAVLVPLAVSFLFFAIKRELGLWLRMVFNPWGIGIFLLLAGPWYLAQYLKEGEAFIQGFFFKHNIDRFQSPMEKHGGSILYYLPVVLLAVMPYPSLLIRSLSRLRSLLKDDFGLFALLWAGFVIAFFSLSGTKLPHYVLYGLSGLFVLMARQVAPASSRFWLLLPALVWFTLQLALPLLLDILQPKIDDPFAREMLGNPYDHFSVIYWVLSLLGVVVVLWFMIEHRFAAGMKLLISGILTALSLSLLLLPLVGEIKQGPIKEAAMLALDKGYEPVRWKLNTPSFSVYTGRIMESRRPEPGEIALTKAKFLNELKHYQVLYQRRGVVLVKVSDPPREKVPEQKQAVGKSHKSD